MTGEKVAIKESHHKENGTEGWLSTSMAAGPGFFLAWEVAYNGPSESLCRGNDGERQGEG